MGGTNVVYAAHDYQWSDDKKTLTVNCGTEDADKKSGLVTGNLGSENSILDSIIVNASPVSESGEVKYNKAIHCNNNSNGISIYAKNIELNAGGAGIEANDDTDSTRSFINIGSEKAITDKLVIKMSDAGGNRAISSRNNASVNIFSKSIEIYTNSQGIVANGEKNPGKESTAYINIGSKNAYCDNLFIGGIVEGTAANYGIAATYNGEVNIYAKNIEINSNKYGIYAQGEKTEKLGNHINIYGGNLKVNSLQKGWGAVVAHKKESSVTIGDKDTKMDSVDLTGTNAIYALGGHVGINSIKSNIKVNDRNAGNAINVSNAGTVDIDSDELNIYGDIYNSNGKLDIQSDTGTIIGDISTNNSDGVSNISFGNKDDIKMTNTPSRDATTTFTGKVKDNYSGKTNLSIYGNSLWNMTDTSEFNSLDLTGGATANLAYSKNYKKLIVNELSGNEGVFNLKINASTNKNNSDRIYVNGKHEGVHYITLDNIAADGTFDGAEGTVIVSVKDEKGEFKANDSEGTLYWNTYELGRYDADKGDTVTENYETDWYLKKAEKVNKPTTSVDSVLSMNSLNYHTWRTENDKLLQRMGELRHNGEEEKGAWFRVKGSKIGYDGGFENKYTTYELGYDEVTKRAEDVVRYQGAALSYVDGKSSYNSGSGDNHGKSIGFYTTEQYSKGHYLDLVFKISNMDNDFKVFDTKGNEITGEYDNTGVSISAEYGRKNDLDHGWYIEPQAQLTLGYMGGAKYETSNGIFVDQSGIKSALGRIGFNIGKKIGEKGIVYAKANLLHEFGGGYDVEMRAADGSLTMSNTYNDTWFEYGVGVAMATSDNSHIYFDVERSTGSDFYKDWQWNAGMRWNF